MIMIWWFNMVMPLSTYYLISRSSPAREMWLSSFSDIKPLTLREHMEKNRWWNKIWRRKFAWSKYVHCCLYLKHQTSVGNNVVKQFEETGSNGDRVNKLYHRDENSATKIICCRWYCRWRTRSIISSLFTGFGLYITLAHIT